MTGIQVLNVIPPSGRCVGCGGYFSPVKRFESKPEVGRKDGGFFWKCRCHTTIVYDGGQIKVITAQQDLKRFAREHGTKLR